MENPFEELKARCKAAGVTLGRVCDMAGIQRSTIWYWKNHPPTQIQMYRKLLETIEQLSNAKSTPVSE